MSFLELSESGPCNSSTGRAPCGEGGDWLLEASVEMELVPDMEGTEQYDKEKIIIYLL